MIMNFQELKSEHVLNLVFCLNYFDYCQSVGRWVSGRWVDGSMGKWSVSRWVSDKWVGAFNKTLFKDMLNYLSSQIFCVLNVLDKKSWIFVICNHHLICIN